MTDIFDTLATHSSLLCNITNTDTGHNSEVNQLTCKQNKTENLSHALRFNVLSTTQGPLRSNHCYCKSHIQKLYQGEQKVIISLVKNKNKNYPQEGEVVGPNPIVGCCLHLLLSQREVGSVFGTFDKTTK